MSPTALRKRAKQRLNALSPERLRVADDFLAYLEQRESDEATEELLRIPGFVEGLQRAEEDIRAGRLTRAEDLRRKS
jgi:hypothetical protein